jgi:hypothetical protein
MNEKLKDSRFAPQPGKRESPFFIMYTANEYSAQLNFMTNFSVLHS